jgi:hypothetical protein
MIARPLLENEGGANRRTDWFSRWLIYWGVGIPLSLILLAASPFGTNFFYVVAGIPLLLFLWALAASWSLILCVLFAVRRIWRSSLACAILPIAALIVCLDPLGFLRGCDYLGDVLHFVIARPYYERVIAGLPHDGRLRIVVFNWGGMVWASRGLVYDESDEVALPAGKQSAAWLASPHLAELGCGGFSAQPLWSHYYLVSFPC